MQWLSDVFEKKKDDQEFWDYASNGDEVAKLLQNVTKNHQATIGNSKDHKVMLTRMSDILIGRGSRLAAQVQQELAKLR